MKAVWALSSLLVMLAVPAFTWDGINTVTGGSVEIGKGNLVRSGEEVELYDYGTGTYRYVTVEEVNGSGNTVQIEAYDYESGEYLYLEMED